MLNKLFAIIIIIIPSLDTKYMLWNYIIMFTSQVLRTTTLACDSMPYICKDDCFYSKVARLFP